MRPVRTFLPTVRGQNYAYFHHIFTSGFQEFDYFQPLIRNFSDFPDHFLQIRRIDVREIYAFLTAHETILMKITKVT